MKHILTLAAFAPMLVMGQALVTQQPENRTALLEDFTGIHCVNCPAGHIIMANIENAMPDRVVNVGVHAGGYAVPSGNQPDFRTPEGTTLDNFFPIQGYPNGVINRHTFAAGLAMGRGAWAAAVDEIIELPSPVNVGVSSSFDAGARDLTVDVEAYYTDDSPAGNDYFSVFIKEDHIIGYQADNVGPTTNTYDHTHVLRGYVTAVWGEDLGTNPTAGTSVTRQYTFNVPTDWDISNCVVVAFASEYQSEVYQAKEVVADGGTTLVTGTLNSLASSSYIAGQSGTNQILDNELNNLLGADEDYMIELVSTNAPSDWGAGFVVNGNIYIAPTTVTIAAAASLGIDVQISPGASAAIADYTLKITSASYPSAPALTQDYHVISGVTDLVVENLGAEDHTPIFVDGLAAANQAGRGNTTRSTFTAFGEANALAGVKNIYYNVSWTFPGLVDGTVAVLSNFLDYGGNLLISGQDIGWDNSGAANSNGTPATMAFYSDYMHADYVDDGSTANNQVNFNAGDAIFGGVASSSINNIFGTNSYPEEIAPLNGAVEIYTYNTGAVGGIRFGNWPYKVVYLGVGLEQFSDASVAEQVVMLSHDWFYSDVSVEEFDAAFAALGQAYPVPADQQVTIPLNNLEGVSTLHIISAEGKTIATHSVSQGVSNFILDTSELAAGVYAYQLVAADGSMATKAMTVSH